MSDWEIYYDKLMRQKRDRFLTWGEVAEAMFNFGMEHALSNTGHRDNNQEQGKPVHK